MDAQVTGEAGAGGAGGGLRVEVGVAWTPAEGEEVSGDEHVVATAPDGSLVVAAIDGLGHGAAARKAAASAAAALAGAVGLGSDPVSLLETVHASLTETRGAAITLARIDPVAGSLTWLGVGNVEGRLLRSTPGPLGAPVTVSAMLLAGVVGAQLPVLRAVSIPWAPGDTLLLATDGLSPSLADDLRVAGALQPLADGLLHRNRRSRDDALVVLVRLT